MANIFLSVLFHDVNLDYHTPIISQQGEVAGRLQIEIQKVAGNIVPTSHTELMVEFAEKFTVQATCLQQQFDNSASSFCEMSILWWPPALERGAIAMF